MVSTNCYFLLRQELEPVYASLRSNERHPAWKLPNCIDWSRLALPLARSVLGESVQRVAYDHDYVHELQEGYGLPGGYHAYLVDLNQQDPLVICGTYLQFAFSDSTATEHVLISPASETSTLLHDARVDKGAWPYFRPDLYLDKTIKIAP